MDKDMVLEEHEVVPECENCARLEEMVLQDTDRMANSRDSIVNLRRLVKKYRGLYKIAFTMSEQLLEESATRDRQLQELMRLHREADELLGEVEDENEYPDGTYTIESKVGGEVE